MNTLSDKLRRLGITPEMQAACSHPVCEETTDLVDAGPDMFDRPSRMTPRSRAAWQAMKLAAQQDGIELRLVSAFRSVDYQCEVIQRKLDDGRSIDDILGVNAIPGHSEHHTGRALDLHTDHGEPLTEAFERTDAFDWLCRHAANFGFRMSYPRDNTLGIDYEPWHWCFSS